MKLLYLVHDLKDAAVRRRVSLLAEGGARVALVGFRRRSGFAPQAEPGGLAIGHTQDGRMVRRAASTVWAVVAFSRWRDDVRNADVIMARSLEMLLIAVFVRRRIGLNTPIVYECLDIHRLMTGPGLVGVLLRRLERRLLRSCSLLIVSSQKFIEAYFAHRHPQLPRWLLLENKLLSSEMERGAVSGPLHRPVMAAGPPWRIGWFGIIRCRRSLELLAALVRASNGAVEVEIRGRPALDVVPEFSAVVAETPGLTFGGPYDRTIDLAGMYGRVHFNWAIDFYEDGLNSAWLLPNRLYEGSMYGSVPLALRQVETGRWLARHDCGLLLDAPLERTLPALFATMAASVYLEAQRRVAELDPTSLMETPDTAVAFVATLGQLRAPSGGVEPTLAPARMT